MSDGRFVEGYFPGCIGDIAGLHARFYARAWNFGVYFEHKVAAELGAFCETLPRDDARIWSYVDAADRCRASVTIDGDSGAGVAHLRWFIADDTLRGTGVGRQLLAQAMAFCDARFESTYLWTFKGLDAARRLYDAAGFRLVLEQEGMQWGSMVTEQRFERERPA